MSTTDAASRILESIGREARRRGEGAYLVGGALRDRLRRRVPRDLDVAVAGDAPAFARSWARTTGGDVRATPEFGTASVQVGKRGRPLRVDFSSTRGERYRHPGALPEVFPDGIEADLARRDFTINAMAMPLGSGGRARLIDPCGGREDLRRRRIRMLHGRSPHDDPTRAFRAVRLALRLGFAIEPRTRRWIADAAASGAFRRVSGDRWRRELSLLWAEQSSVAGAAALERLGLGRAIDSALELRPADRRRLAALGRLRTLDAEDRVFAALLAWTLDRPDRDRERIADRFGLGGRRREEFVRAGADRARAADLRRRGSPVSDLAAEVRRWSPMEALAVESSFPRRDREALRKARERARTVRLSIGGTELLRSGLRSGPAIGRALDRTWRARVDGRISAAQELAYAVAEGSA